MMFISEDPCSRCGRPNNLDTLSMFDEIRQQMRAWQHVRDWLNGTPEEWMRAVETVNAGTFGMLEMKP